mmetsp:Transcript_15421/g.21966  ORF Transcript_15421/g.21966 Transcript_15421/m.21966 type:complete len:963 (+) Transcript_15421:236-3124(+)
MSTGNLHAKWLSYQNVFSKKIMYPLIGHSMSVDDLKIVQQPTDRELLHLLGLNEHFPRAVLHASTSFGGMGCPTFHAQHVVDKVVLFLHHMKEKAELAEVFQASMSLTQLECGTSKPFFSLPADPWYDLVTPTWINHIWQECIQKGIELLFYEKAFWLPGAQREHDFTIMDLAAQLYGGSHLVRINQCRIYLQVVYLSDITSVDGCRILHAYFEGKGHEAAGRESRLNWPPIGILPKTHWTLWKEFLHQLCGTSLRLPTPLGGWYADSEILTRIKFLMYEQRLIKYHQKTWFDFRPYYLQSRTRFRNAPFPFTDLHLIPAARVVDITECNDSIYIVSQSDQLLIPGTPDIIVHSIQDLYQTLPRSLQRIAGVIEWPDEDTTHSLAEAIRQGNAVGASDGSVRAHDDEATHAWIIQAPNGAAITGRGPVDGTSQVRTSHRAEIQGQVGIFLMVATLVQFYTIIKGHITTYCDNLPVVTKIQKGWQLLRLKHTKGSDTDLQVTLRHLFTQLGKGVTHKTLWVQSHQDKNMPLHSLPQEVALNVRMDAETKVAYDLPLEWQTQGFVDVLPAEGCAVYIANRKISSALSSTLLAQWHAAEAQEYLLSRHDIDTSLFSVIQWTAMKYALEKLNYHRRATAVKAIHRHLPTQDKLFQQGRVTMCTLCPQCISHPETNAHVYSCTNKEALQQRLIDWGDLQKQLTSLKTALVIQRVWSIHMRPLLALHNTPDILETVLVDTHGDVHFFLRAAIAEQDRIGWDKLLLGMGSSLWQSLQQHIDSNNPRPPQRTASDWINRAMHQLIKFSLRCWKSRNIAVHGATFKEGKQKALERARQSIRSLYAQPPSLDPQFRPITEVPLLHRLRLSLPAAEHWLALVNHQIRATAHNLRILMKQHRPIPEHFTAMEQECQRNLAQQRRLLSRDFPRRAHSREVQNAVKKKCACGYIAIFRPCRASFTYHGTHPRHVHH